MTVKKKRQLNYQLENNLLKMRFLTILIGESFIRELVRASQAAEEMRSTPKLSLTNIEPEYNKSKKRYLKKNNFISLI